MAPRLFLLAGMLILPGLFAAAVLAVLVVQPEGPLATAVREISTLALAGGLVVFAVALALSAVIARSIARPVAALARSLGEARTALRDSEAERRALGRELEQRGTERMRQFTASEALLRAFFDNSPDSLALVRATPDGRFLCEDFNPAFETALSHRASR